VHVDFTPEQHALRHELRAYFDDLLTPEVRAGLTSLEGGEGFKNTVERMGSDGWLGVGWPKEYGGQGRTAVEQLIWFEEARKSGAPFPFVTLNTVGPTLIAQGTEEQKRRFLPGILAGTTHFAIGYTEPDAGTDLASLKTSAVRDGDYYVVNGTKIFTSGANQADYIWLACRTSTEGRKHDGISILIVDTKLPGFSWSPIETIGGGFTTMSYYENVRVPADMIVAGENRGWKLITLQLNHERVGLAAFGCLGEALIEDVADWALATEGPDGGFVADSPWVHVALGEACARIEALKVLNWRMAWGIEQGSVDAALASAVKVYGTETVLEIYRLLMDVLGILGTFQADSPGAILQGRLEEAWRGAQINTYGGGVNEVQRSLVASLGLRMPRTGR
jgi:hypothetical protein